MSKLNEQLQRLYAPPAGTADIDAPLALVGADGRVRTLVVGLARGSDWPALAALYAGLQTELELPAPAVSVSPVAGFQLWLSLAEPLAAADAADLLEALRRRFLAELPAARVALLPAAGAAEVAPVPALDAASGKWSAFIDPSMGSLFADEAGLEFEPNLERQADMLAACRSITSRELARARALLADTAGEALPAATEPTGRTRSTLAVGGNFSDPRAFLLAVMNDPSASAKDRIRAAQALLPYFTAQPPARD